MPETTSEENKAEETKSLKAKTVSLISKIIAGIIVLCGAFLKWAGVLPNCEISELCTVGFTIMGIFGTIDVNIALDKFTKKGE